MQDGCAGADLESALPLWLRWLCGGLLAMALSCNLAVLFVPFLEFRQVLTVEAYTIFHTVEMLWSAGLHALSFLVVGFSIVFPFFKLAVLFAVVLPASPGPIRRRLLARVEPIAKWSMLDVFLVCLVLTLTSGQFLVGATPREGVALFIGAIILSMVVGQVLASRLLRGREHTEGRGVLHRLGGKIGDRTRMALTVGAGLALAGALFLPFLRIEAWFLIRDSFSVVTVLPSLWEQGSYSGAFATAVFLVVAPVARWCGLALFVWRARQSGVDPVPGRFVRLARYWSMLDVFALALAVFLLEGGRLVPSDAEAGAFALVGFVLVITTVERLVEGRGERVVADGARHRPPVST